MIRFRPSPYDDIEHEGKHLIHHWFIDAIYKEVDEYIKKNGSIPTKLTSKYLIGYEKKNLLTIDTQYGKLEVVVDPELDCLLKVE